MDEAKKKAVQNIVDSEIKRFAEAYEKRFTDEADDPDGVINSKKNNCFVSELGKEFMFYSAFVRSFDSSFGKVFERNSGQIARRHFKCGGDGVCWKGRRSKRAALFERCG